MLDEAAQRNPFEIIEQAYDNNPKGWFIATIIRTVIKLVPIAIHLRSDRKQWLRKQGRDIDEKKFKKHAEGAMRSFISLGPSYVKLGQWLSSRSDILPQPYLDVFAKLQDDVPPAPFKEIEPTIEKELGKIDNIFDSFNTSPISGASIGQVYLAKLKGNDVIVKVSRPNIENLIARDIYILKRLIPFATSFIDKNLRFSAEGMLTQFIETIYEEMDYRIEAQNLLEITRNLKDDSSVIIPQLYESHTSKHVLVLEYLPGIKITDVESLEKIGISRSNLVIRIHRLFFKMLLRHSIFHADPHPGNISVAPDGSIILYDFGMVGRLDTETRTRLVRLYLGLIDRDPVRTTDVLIELGTLEPSVNRSLVEKGLELSISSLHGQKVDRMQVKALQELANRTLSRFPFKLPKNLALYMRMASILEGIYLHHKVKFQFVRVLSNLLEEEGLVKDAYVEEVKRMIMKYARAIESSSELVPMLRQYLNDRNEMNFAKRNNFLIPSAILSAAIFVGSALIFPYSISASTVGIISSSVIMCGAILYTRFYR